ncbi:hypothetical protein EON63_16410 [archaeon]|nr:MAG: hypothetical protein EON63_16410 [archaeon]
MRQLATEAKSRMVPPPPPPDKQLNNMRVLVITGTLYILSILSRCPLMVVLCRGFGAAHGVLSAPKVPRRPCCH